MGSSTFQSSAQLLPGNSFSLQCWGSLTFWCGPPDPYLWLMDPDPTPDPTPFFNDFKDVKKKISYFFLITYPQVHHLQS
jgi:hypothetical protein